MKYINKHSPMKGLGYLLLLFWLSACSGESTGEDVVLPTEVVSVPTIISAPVTTPATTVAAPPAETEIVPTATATEIIPTATVVEPAFTATAVGEAMPVRIQFAPGESSITLMGHVAVAETISYLAEAAAGQHAHIEIVSQNNVANFSLVGVTDGQPYKRLENENRFWDGTLPTSQDYEIRVRALEEADYTLLITIDPLGANVLQPVWPIVDGTSGFLLGGSHNGQWLDAISIMPSLQDGERSYQLYAGSELKGQISASPPTTPLEGPCGGTPQVSFSADSFPSDMLAIVARWDAAPRQSQSLPLDTELYVSAVEEYLVGQGVPAPEAHLTSLEKIDLEGDGVDEVLVIAQRLTGLGEGLPTASAGDYSLILLRTVVNSEVISLPLAQVIFTEDVELADPVQYNLMAILDLNGDGKLEIVIEGRYFEGRFVNVFERIDQDVQLIFSVGCRL